MNNTLYIMNGRPDGSHTRVRTIFFRENALRAWKVFMGLCIAQRRVWPEEDMIYFLLYQNGVRTGESGYDRVAMTQREREHWL